MKKREEIEELINIKNFFIHAKNHNFARTAEDRMLSILGLDNCFEYLINLIAKKREFDTVIEAKYFPSKLKKMKEISERSGFKLHGYNFLRNDLHQMRNLVQHGHVFPSEQINRTFSDAEGFLNGFLRDHFGCKNLREIKFQSYFKDPMIKRYLDNFDRDMKAQNFKKALAHIRNGFDWCLEKTISNSFIFRGHDLIVIETAQNEPDPTKGYFFRELFYRTILTALGLSIFDFYRYAEIVNHLPREFWIGERYLYAGSFSEAAITEEEVWFCYDFVCGVLYEWERFFELNFPDFKYGINDYKYEKEKPSHAVFIGKVTIPESIYPQIFSPTGYSPGSEPERFYDIYYFDDKSHKKLIKNIKTGNIYRRRIFKTENNRRIKTYEKTVRVILNSGVVVVNKPLIYRHILGYEDIE